MAVSKKARALYWAVFDGFETFCANIITRCRESKNLKKYMTCGINSDGTLKKYAYGYNTGKKFDKHPQGLIFAGYTVPFYDNAVELVKKAHPTIAHFRLVSWDIAIGEKGEAILIEANMRK